MPEYFVISIIKKKKDTAIPDIERCLNKLDLYIGSCSTQFFPGKEIITFVIDDDSADYNEIVISIPDYRFTRETLSKDLQPISFLIESVFSCDKDVVMALCAFEINGYLLGGLMFDEICEESLMQKFPIVYKRSTSASTIIIDLHLEAQDIF
jgi:hypothetical protein